MSNWQDRHEEVWETTVRNYGTGGACLIYIVMYVLLWLLTSSLFQYTIMVWFEKNLPWYVDMLGGAICTSFIVPVAFITWVLQLCGVTQMETCGCGCCWFDDGHWQCDYVVGIQAEYCPICGENLGEIIG